MLRPLAAPSPENLANFNQAPAANQAVMRNEIVTARMYIADMEYHTFEARLTREMQDEGIFATAVNLGLTTSATLIPVAQTKTLLSGIATGVTGLDKAYNEKELLSNTIQALQTQMRADRKTQAGTIYAKLFKDAGNNTKTITSIAEYTLPMALSDTDAYYQAGTVASALIGLSKTVANADRNAEQAKDLSGPNPAAVKAVKDTAVPRNNTPPSGSSLRFTSTVVANNDAVVAVLKKYLNPDGVPNSEHAAVISAFLTEKNLNVSITFFLNASMFSAERTEIARRLKLIS
jgi:hypothetical protein